MVRDRGEGPKQKPETTLAVGIGFSRRKNLRRMVMARVKIVDAKTLVGVQGLLVDYPRFGKPVRVYWQSKKSDKVSFIETSEVQSVASDYPGHFAIRTATGSRYEIFPCPNASPIDDGACV